MEILAPDATPGNGRGAGRVVNGFLTRIERIRRLSMEHEDELERKDSEIIKYDY